MIYIYKYRGNGRPLNPLAGVYSTIYYVLCNGEMAHGIGGVSFLIFFHRMTSSLLLLKQLLDVPGPLFGVLEL